MRCDAIVQIEVGSSRCLTVCSMIFTWSAVGSLPAIPSHLATLDATLYTYNQSI